MRIGELSKVAGCTPETVRFYESRGVLSRPRRTPSGYRDYERTHVRELIFARHFRTLGLTLDEAAGLLALQRKPENGCDSANRLVDQRIGEVRSQLASLRSLMRHLKSLRAKCCESQRSKECGILQTLSEQQ